MRPVNEMSSIPSTDFACEIITETLVRFYFNLNKYPQLRNQAVVMRCMQEYVYAYPTVSGWAGKITGDQLIIDVNGSINPKYYGK